MFRLIAVSSDSATSGCDQAPVFWEDAQTLEEAWSDLRSLGPDLWDEVLHATDWGGLLSLDLWGEPLRRWGGLMSLDQWDEAPQSTDKEWAEDSRVSFLFPLFVCLFVCLF